MARKVLLSGAVIVTGVLVGGIATAAVAPAPVSPPHIVAQANALTGHKYATGTNKPVPYPAYSDGCNHDYGTPTQCVPLTSPRSFHGGKDKAFDCAYLVAEGLFRKPLLVRRDSHNVLPRHKAAGKAIPTPAGWVLTGCVQAP